MPVRSPGPMLSLLIVAGHQGRLRKNEAMLAAYSRALGLSLTKLWALVTTKPEKWWARHLAVSEGCPYSQAAMREALIREFVVDEATQCLVELVISDGGLWAERMLGKAPWPGLCRQRPLRPAIP